jgi:hypothetical protein
MALKFVGHRFAEAVVQDPMSKKGIGQDILALDKGTDLVDEAPTEIPINAYGLVHLFLSQIGPVSSAQMTQEKKTSIITSRDEGGVVRFRPDRFRLRDELALA